MTDLVITATDVTAGTGSGDETVDAGATVVRGEPCYLDLTDGSSAKPASASSVATAKFKGVALNDSDDGQPVTLWTSGTLTLGAILTIGIVYVISLNTGKIAPLGDLVTGNIISLIGIADTTTTLQAIGLSTGVPAP